MTDDQDKGEPAKYDPTFKGPIQNRGCTDIICCLLFIVFFLGMFAVAILAFANGDPRVLLYPADSDGNLCGYNEFKDKPNVFFFDLLACAKMGAIGTSLTSLISLGCPTPQVCVADCPSKYWVWAPYYAKEQISGSLDINARKQMICKNGISAETSSKTIKELVDDDDCASYYTKSSGIVGRCIPSIFKEIVDKTKKLIDENGDDIVDAANNTITGSYLEEGSKFLALFLSAREYGIKIFQDVRAAWWLILVGLGLTVVLSFIWILLLRWVAGIIVWLTILLFIAIFGAGAGFCFYKYWQMRKDPAAQLQGSLEFTTNLSYYTDLAETWLVLGIILAVIWLIILILLIFLRSRIRIAIAIIKATSKGIGNMVFTLFWPLIPFVLQVILLGFWGCSAVFLASMGKAKYAGSSISSEFNETVQKYVNVVADKLDCDTVNATAKAKFCHFLGNTEEYSVYLQFYQLFMLFWCMNFIIALGQMTLAGAFASYYWAFEKPKNIPAFPVSASLFRSLRYHLGTLAFGSLIIAIIQIIRVALEYLDHKLKGSENMLAKCMLKCLKCFFWCLEKFMKFINKNAYIMCAVYGKNFCSSAHSAFFLILRNIVRVVVIDKVTDFVMFISKLVIVACIGTLCYFFFSGELANQIPHDTISKYLENYNPELNYYFIPIIIIIIGSYVIASAFFSVYSMGVDTLFLCFLEDLEKHDGSPEKPYYMSKDLMDILGKKNDAIEMAKKK